MPSDYIICVDESGDLGLRNFNANFPIFLVAMAIFNREEYENEVVPAFESLKREFFGHVDVPLHEIDIRRNFGPIRLLPGENRRDEFRAALREEIGDSQFKIVAAAIDKRHLARPSSATLGIYDQCFLGCALSLQTLWPDLKIHPDPVELVVESRGRIEDEALRTTVTELSQGTGPLELQTAFELRFVGKADLHIGVEIADLIANPIAREVLGMRQPALSFDLIRDKFLGNTDSERPASLIVFGDR